MFWIFCPVQLNETFSKKEFDNLTKTSSYTEIQNTVQVRTNNIEIVVKWIGQWHSVIYSFFIGSLSDDYGRKPCIIFPMV